MNYATITTLLYFAVRSAAVLLLAGWAAFFQNGPE